MEFLIVVFQTIRVLGAIGMVTFLPGFVFSFVLFPNQPKPTYPENGLDRLERLYISVISSLSMSAFSAYLLYRAGFGLTPVNMLVVLLIITAVFLIGLLLKSGKLPLRAISREKLSALLPLQPEQRARAFAPWFGYSILFILWISFILFRFGNKDLEPLTEFYIQPDRMEEQGIEYSIDGETLTVAVAITNRERVDRTYRIEAEVPPRNVTLEQGVVPHTEDLIGSQRQVLKNIIVKSGDTYEDEVSIAITGTEAVPYVDLLLFNIYESEPSTRLRVWLAPEKEYANP